MNNLDQILHKQFGYKDFLPGQKEIITSVIQKKDVVAILPTGGGKTLCYHLSAKLLKGLTIVITPLLSLMEDQVHQLRAKGDKTVMQINGLLTFQEKKRVLSNINEDTILFLSPEMLSNENIMNKLCKLRIGLFVVDEAHCISQWGHEFRTDYLRLHSIRSALGNPPCFALTATATKAVEEDIIKQLGMESPIIHRNSVNRKQIKFIVEKVDNNTEKKALFKNYLSKIQKPAIIYTATRKEAIMLSNEIKKEGYEDVAFYHGGMVKEDRLLVQHQFINNEINYICSTNAFGMGINKPNVRTVIHYHLPSSVEQYVQEVGRAGRDGNESIAILLYNKEDRIIPLSFIDREFPSKIELKTWFDAMKNSRRSEGIGFKLETMKELFQIDDNRWKMLLYYLEKSGVIQEKELQIELLNNKLVLMLNERFSTRKKTKQKRLIQLEQMMNSDTCIRGSILHYFDELTEEQVAPCCSSCGFTMNQAKVQLFPKEKNEVVDVSNTWESKLRKMLFPYEGRL
ncbi:ATP-dependent DNA helicase [Evansella sp. AB-P1]|uniref:RecQ family ATP-dependent DNA helicase n=1 Tax=Evansella sp. AB-P1 TaxID=3037653 RepID=UPI00241C84BA|nr:ATP-dependent DNA helicase RecQ [Evansella sp. AB-P1]MDG5787640.1 ATP-dependent DNA helicase [Evansella sp. AB-P1]